jgi:hypothetical protein
VSHPTSPARNRRLLAGVSRKPNFFDEVAVDRCRVVKKATVEDLAIAAPGDGRGPPIERRAACWADFDGLQFRGDRLIFWPIGAGS